VQVPVRKGGCIAREMLSKPGTVSRADLEFLDTVAQELADVDRRVDELNRRAAALVSSQVDVDYPGSGRNACLYLTDVS